MAHRIPSLGALPESKTGKALATAWGWQYSRPGEKIHHRRVTILLLALATVVIGWPLERHVSVLRDDRHARMDAYFQSNSAEREEARTQALDTRSEFGQWHTYSLFLNFATLALVTVGMALTARLPHEEAITTKDTKTTRTPSEGEAAEPKSV